MLDTIGTLAGYAICNVALRFFNDPSAAPSDKSVYWLTTICSTMNFAMQCCVILLIAKEKRHTSIEKTCGRIMLLCLCHEIVNARGLSSYIFDREGNILSLDRYVVWTLSSYHTIKLVGYSINLSRKDTHIIFAFDALMFLFGFLASVSVAHWPYMLALSFAACFARLGLTVYHSVKAKRLVGASMTALTYMYFPVIWTMGMAHVLDSNNLEIYYTCGNFCSKVLITQTIAIQFEHEMRSAYLSSKLMRRETMAATIAHELRTPLNGIIHLSDSIKTGQFGFLTQHGNDYLGIISSCAHKLNAIINDIVELNTLTREKLYIRKERISIRGLIEHVATMVKPMVRESVEFKTEVDSNLPFFIVGDETRLSQVLINLLGNACKFTFMGYINLHARWDEKDVLTLTVTDSGIGMSSTKFAIVASAMKSAEDSDALGLGLNIANAIVRAHGGHLEVESSAGNGAKFVVFIPQCNVPAKILQEDGTVIIASTTSKDGTIVSELTKCAVLSIDDNYDNQVVIKDVLTAKNFDVDCRTPESFTPSTMNRKYDVVLIHYHMLAMSGIALTRKIRESSLIPIIVISASHRQNVIVESLEAGASDFVKRPFSRAELIARIKYHVHQDDTNLISHDYQAHILESIIPSKILYRMRCGQKLIADSHHHVCVMFTDIVGFTKMCNRLPTTEIYTMLNNMFNRFDDLTDRFGIYKVETIGDAYMAVSGHDEDDTKTRIGPPVYRMVQYAKSLLEAVADMTTSDGEQVQIRIGMHCGSALSGVIGTKCPRYCFFGDTINTASRMESCGFPGIIHVSAAIVDAYNDTASFEMVGKKNVKGKGIMTTYAHNTSHTSLSLKHAEEEGLQEDVKHKIMKNSTGHDLIGHVLSEAKLPQYISLFRNQGVDISILIDLTDADLVSLGISTTSERLRILKSIAKIARDTMLAVFSQHA